MKPKKIIPFFIIFVLVVYLAQRRENAPLPAPGARDHFCGFASIGWSRFYIAGFIRQNPWHRRFKGKCPLVEFFRNLVPSLPR